MSTHTVQDSVKGFVPGDETAESLVKEIIIGRLGSLKNTLECGSGNELVYETTDEFRRFEDKPPKKVCLKMTLTVEIVDTQD